MTRRVVRIVATCVVAGCSVALAACGTSLGIGDTDAVKEATELAIDCKTDEALAAIERAQNSGGFGAAIGDLERVVILRDAGRTEEADQAMADRNERARASAEEAADADAAVAETLEKLRSERETRTGRRTCP